MLKVALVAITQLGTLCATFYYEMGSEYIREGYGFHPIAAGVVVTICVIAPYVVARSVAALERLYQYEEETEEE